MPLLAFAMPVSEAKCDEYMAKYTGISELVKFKVEKNLEI